MTECNQTWYECSLGAVPGPSPMIIDKAVTGKTHKSADFLFVSILIWFSPCKAGHGW